MISPLSTDFIHIYSDPQAGAAKSSVDMSSGESSEIGVIYKVDLLFMSMFGELHERVCEET